MEVDEAMEVEEAMGVEEEWERREVREEKEVDEEEEEEERRGKRRAGEGAVEQWTSTEERLRVKKKFKLVRYRPELGQRSARCLDCAGSKKMP